MQGLQALDQFKSFVSKIGGLGRYEDTYIVHAAEGETVVPMEVLDRNPVSVSYTHLTLPTNREV